jgi:hypothetical protein
MTTEPTPKPAAPEEPLTDPADLLMLLGRFVAACVLMVMTLALLLQREYTTAMVVGAVTFILQISTTRTWRRLREERLAKKEAREAARAEEAEVSA